MLRILAGIFCALFALTSAHAAGYPDRPIRLVVPYSPGGGADIIARLIGPKLSTAVGQPVVIDNRPGANGNIGSDIVAKAKPDGYTLLINTIGLVFSQSIYKKLPFNVLTDLSPVVLVAGTPYLLVVKSSLPAKSVSELIAEAKAKPGALNCATVGVGSPFQMSAELFKSLAHVKVTNIPFQGGGPAVMSLLGGQTDMTFANLLAVQSFVRAGKIRALAVTTSRRSPIMPDTPTMAESGLPGYDLNGWFGIWAPAGTPPAVVATLNAEINKILKDPEIHDRLEKDGAVVEGGSATHFARYIKSEFERWDPVVKAAGIEVK